MASFTYNISLKTNAPLEEEDLYDLLTGFFGEDNSVHVLDFDLEDESYSQV